MAEIDLAPDPPKRSALPILLGIVAVVVLAIGAVVVLAGDDGGGDVDAVSLLGAAPGAARDAGSARIVMRTETSGNGMSFTMDATGVTDFESGDMSLEMSMMGQDIELRSVDGTSYMRMPQLTQAAGITQSWVAMPAETGGQAMSLTGPTSVTGFLDAMRGMSNDDIEELGAREVNGYDAHGFRITVNLEKALEQLPEEQRADAEAGLAQMQTMGLSEWPMEIWVTDDALPVRWVMEMDVQGIDSTMTMDLTDFGVDATVVAPPEADVLRVSDQAELQRLLGGMSTGEETVEPAA